MVKEDEGVLSLFGRQIQWSTKLSVAAQILRHSGRNLCVVTEKIQYAGRGRIVNQNTAGGTSVAAQDTECNGGNKVVIQNIDSSEQRTGALYRQWSGLLQNNGPLPSHLRPVIVSSALVTEGSAGEQVS